MGDETLAMTLGQRAATTRVRFYVLTWRQDNVAAWVSVNGFDRRLRLADAVELARKQQRRIEAAADA